MCNKKSEELKNVEINFCSRLKQAATEKGMSLKKIAENSKVPYTTVASYLTASESHKNLDYAMAVVLYNVIEKEKIIKSKEELKFTLNNVNDNFFDNLKKKYELKNYTLMSFQKDYNFSKSTLHTYLHRAKNPMLPNAIRLATILNFHLEIDLGVFYYEN